MEITLQDVYKRQGVTNDVTSKPVTVTIKVGGTDQGAVTAVSYTHLDVYKRQVIRKRRRKRNDPAEF